MKNKEEKTKSQIIGEALCGILMLVCIIVYLILGLTLNFWHPGWLIPVSGAIACGIIEIISNTITDLKQIDKKENKNE